jgi:hypothetical protein
MRPTSRQAIYTKKVIVTMVVRMLQVLLSTGAIYSFIPVIIIVVLVAAAAGLGRGWDIFSVFGFTALTDFARMGRGKVGKGFQGGSRYNPGGIVKTQRYLGRVPSPIKGSQKTGTVSGIIGSGMKSAATRGTSLEQKLKEVNAYNLRMGRPLMAPRPTTYKERLAEAKKGSFGSIRAIALLIKERPKRETIINVATGAVRKEWGGSIVEERRERKEALRKAGGRAALLGITSGLAPPFMPGLEEQIRKHERHGKYGYAASFKGENLFIQGNITEARARHLENGVKNDMKKLNMWEDENKRKAVEDSLRDAYNSAASKYKTQGGLGNRLVAGTAKARLDEFHDLSEAEKRSKWKKDVEAAWKAIP